MPRCDVDSASWFGGLERVGPTARLGKTGEAAMGNAAGFPQPGCKLPLNSGETSV